MEQALKQLQEAEEELKKHREFPKILYSIANEVKCLYYWQKQDFKLYNEVVQKFLAYTEGYKINSEDQYDISVKAVLSLLLCNSSLNFGDILTNEFF